jgi:hypothetical protein
MEYDAPDIEPEKTAQHFACCLESEVRWIVGIDQNKRCNTLAQLFERASHFEGHEAAVAVSA